MLKLHLIINRGGSIAKASFSPSNQCDRQQPIIGGKNLFGKVFGGHGYISQTLLTTFRASDLYGN